MKKTLTCSLALNGVLVLVVGLSVSGLKTHADGAIGAGGVPAGNGDVNADGEYNLADAIYLLSWLFQGGSAPAPIESSPAGPAGLLPDTGLNTCFDPDGSPVDCAEAVCQGQDGSYATGCQGEGRFTDNQDGTVTDACTGLMWQKETADLNGDGQTTDQDIVPWCEALAYCEGLSLAGHDDWRLPNVRELQSLVDYGAPRSGPMIDPVFSNTMDMYHCSTPLLRGPGPGHYSVSFGLGLLGGGGGVVLFVRAVRGGQ